MAIGEEKIKPTTFRKLMQLRQIHADTFESVTPAWPPALPPGSTIPVSRAFGGHVYAQSAWAASKTVPRGFVVHASLSQILTKLYGGANEQIRM